MEKLASDLLSPVAVSCLYTMGLTARHDDRQTIPAVPIVPPEAVRLLRARLILEEALETVQALGFTPAINLGENTIHFDFESIKYVPCTPSLENIIDGACDTIYVAVGTLVACGVPDVPHLKEVCRANEAKFPGGRVIVGATGKYQKPPDWIAPNHRRAAVPGVDLTVYQESILRSH